MVQPGASREEDSNKSVQQVCALHPPGRQSVACIGCLLPELLRDRPPGSPLSQHNTTVSRSSAALGTLLCCTDIPKWH